MNTQPLPLLPQPAQVERAEGQFTLIAQTPVVAVGGNPHAAKVAAQFAAMVEESFGHKLPQLAETADGTEAATAAATAGAIRIHLDEGAALPREGYVLEITPAGTSIRAGDAAGLFYGAVTLWQLLTGGAGLALPATLPALRITDSPRFRWRGFMLDSARHMQSVEHIKRLIDQAARHKLNTFHWHLVDDQGWRLEIKRYPKLTEIGAWRIPAGKAGIGPDGQPLRYGGFYTQAEARDIVAYAAERHITIVPEIEMPGHARAALAAYPEFGPTGQPTEVTPNWGIHPFIFDVTDEAFAFLENILREVFEIFPGSYIHIGGDEAIKPQWKKSARVQEKIRALGLADENALQSWFIRRIAQFITAQNRKLIGWDEILDGGPLPEGANVMVWHDIKNAAVATRSGHDVVMTPTAYTYLNRAQSLASDETPGHDWVTSLQKVYEFEPIPDDVPQAAAQRIIGYQANLWTEYVRTPRQVDHMLYPRLSAVAENAWSPASLRDWAGFLPRIAAQLRRLHRAGIRAADSAFAVQIDAEPADANAGPNPGRAYVRLSNQAAFGELRYTTDGSEPHADSPRYTGPLALALPVTLTATAFFEGQPIAKPRRAVVDALALRTRSAEKLHPNPMMRAWRLEDDEPLEGERLVVPVDIITPTWVWKQAPLDGIHSLRVEAVDVPYNFAFTEDETGGSHPTPAKDPVYLQLYLGSFDGEPVAQALVDPQQPTPIKAVTLALPAGLSGLQDLHLKFTGNECTNSARQTLWALKRAQLLTQEEATRNQ
ncbi:hypothetical protein AXK11_06535 [Cephaloticoccus primus]|uniref:beta-N-acetylhexosaminidase n=1 Tax=Cephaloticoccus primus TaxID=1548207 RepID=A0A139SLJ6_9BACT|nr:family 20 glycosylhydrolase [Cephaloticoccus primus]KXU35431.1 hypothetical protein AXK11_06535 [Cephaloticoccus primus]